MVADMETEGVVSPSVSPWASPIVLVPKWNNTVLCRLLEVECNHDVYPIPRIEDIILDTLGRGRFFSTLDLSSGFWQIPRDSPAKEKTAFTTHC